MTTTTAQLAARQPVTVCSFDYLSRNKIYDVEKPYYFSGPLEKEQEKIRSNLTYTTHGNVQLRDLRGFEEQLVLDVHGFQLLKHTPRVSLVSPTEEQINNYLTESSAFLKEFLKAEAVISYNYRFRRQAILDEQRDTRQNVGTYKNQDKPVHTPHTDQTVEGGPRRVRHHLTDAEASKYLDGSWRVRIMNCWRPLLHPADERPMAMCDYETVDHSDLVAADRVSREYTGEIFYLQHNENQKWYWISHQKPEEMLLFINYDSDPRGGPLFMAHSSFLNPLAAKDVKPRQSLETALIVISEK